MRIDCIVTVLEISNKRGLSNALLEQQNDAPVSPSVSTVFSDADVDATLRTADIRFTPGTGHSVHTERSKQKPGVVYRKQTLKICSDTYVFTKPEF